MHVRTHTRACVADSGSGGEFRVSAKEPWADTAGVLLRSHSRLYSFPAAAVTNNPTLGA